MSEPLTNDQKIKLMEIAVHVQRLIRGFHLLIYRQWRLTCHES